ncbi:hypothetical protein E9228_002752 [Curtobacterium flaccumfaciens]|uniref:Glycosyl hydrolase family 98 putative carbohydrate-binding module domain-containing protein n=1 Tax=Curtobacterium salicis TaxID=1779862 RepID=A0ABX0TDZ7_9MICO|nr:NPCBM/NEW2 domain-containing protein [Curtobacterium sp. WW7]NII42094.1 hypothetical protein [Curtobacterium sp. WW7]
MHSNRRRRNVAALTLTATAFMFAGLVGIAAPAQAAPAKASISITSLKSSRGDQIVKGGKITIGGKTSTSLRKRYLSVYVTRGRATSKLNISTRVSAASRFSASVPVNVNAGTVKYSLRFGGTSTVQKASAFKSVTVAQWFPLTEQEIVDYRSDESFIRHPDVEQNVSVAGKRYDSAIALRGPAQADNTSWSEWNLGYHCSSFDSKFGIGDDSSAGGRSVLSVSTDGSTRFSTELGLGQTASKTFSIQGAFRLRLTVLAITDSASRPAFPAARILCTSNPGPVD